MKEYVEAKIKAEDVFNFYERVPNGALGSGAFGQVWKAESYDDGKVFAIKTIRNPSGTSLGREIKVTPNTCVAPPHR